MEPKPKVEEISVSYMLTNSPAVTYISKAHGDFGAIFITDNIKDHLGYTPEQFTEDSSFWVNRIHPEDRDRVLQNLAQVFERKTQSHEYRLKDASGNYHWIRDELRLVYNDKGEPDKIIGYWIDISKRKNIEMELKLSNEMLDRTIREQNQMLEDKLQELAEKEKILLQSQKMEAIGQLTGGIAHDFNNTVGVILGFSEIAMLKYGDKEDNKELSHFLTHIIKAGKRASYLVKQLLAFSRGEVGAPRIINPVQYILDSVELLRPTIPSSINIDSVVTKKNDYINIDPTQFNQVIMNLVINAKDAIKNEKGLIKIKVEHEHVERHLCSSCREPFEGDYVVIIVSDSGSGIDLNNNTINSIFEPFYTTKEVGKGSGMGLSVIHGIVHGRDGHILVESKQGVGTTFKIYLPRVSQHHSVEKKSRKEISYANKAANIVVVDDEPSICDFYKDLFEFSGYCVRSFTDPEKALEYCLSNSEKINLLFTDQTMPGLTGEELTKKIHEKIPGLPVIMCTGHSDIMNEERAREVGVNCYLKKPASISRILDSVNQLLD